jgi:hypothetical protein
MGMRGFLVTFAIAAVSIYWVLALVLAAWPPLVREGGGWQATPITRIRPARFAAVRGWSAWPSLAGD